MSHYNNHRVNMRYTEDEENYDDEWYAEERRPQQALPPRIRFDDRIYDNEQRSHQLAPRDSQPAFSRTDDNARRSSLHHDEFEDEMLLRQIGRMGSEGEMMLHQTGRMGRMASGDEMVLRQTGRMGRMSSEDETRLRRQHMGVDRQLGRMGSEDEMLLREMGRMNLGEHRRPSLGRYGSGENRFRRHGDRSHPHDDREAYYDEDWQECRSCVQSRESRTRGAPSGCVHSLHPFGGASGQGRCHCRCHGYDADDEVTITFTSRRRGC